MHDQTIPVSSIMVVRGLYHLRKCINGIDSPTKGRCKYYSVGSHNAAVRLLERKGFKEVTPLGRGATCRGKILKEYLDLVGVLGRKCNSREWWASDTAGKNRFASSRLLVYLQQFIDVLEHVSSKDYDCLIVYNPSWVITPLLRKELSDLNARFVGNWRLSQWMQITASRMRGFLAVLREVGGICCKVIYSRRTFRKDGLSQKSSSGPVVVIKTFVYDSSFDQNGNYRDAFFGSLLDYVKARKDLLVYAVILGEYKSCLGKLKSASKLYTIVPLERYLSFADVFRGTVRILRYRTSPCEGLQFLGHDVTGIVNNEIKRNEWRISLFHYLHYESTCRLLSKVRVESFLYTFENNPWERMCVMAVREHFAKTLLIGYQHSNVCQGEANTFVSKHEADIIPLPDKILTVGDVTREILEKYGAFKEGMIESACALRHEYLFEEARGEEVSLSDRNRSGASATILVALEGEMEACELVDYVLEELDGKDNLDIVIRAHPFLPFERIAKHLKCGTGLPSNARISGGSSLKEDIVNADIVIYRGSTVCVEAIGMGKPAIHFDVETVLSNDPLFLCNHLKRTVSRNDSLEKAVKEILNLSASELEEERKLARAYTKRYFHPITSDNMSKFI